MDEYNLNCAAKSKLAKTLVLSHTNTEMSSRVKADTTEASSELKIVLKSSDMEQSKLEKTFQIAKEAVSRFKLEKDIAAFIKKELDKNFDVYWHCVVGKSFGSYVTHVSGAFAYFYVDKLAVMVFKA